MIAGMQYAAALAAAQQAAAQQQALPSSNNTLQSRQFLLQQLSQQQQQQQQVVPPQQLPIQPQPQHLQQSPTLQTNHPLVKQHPVLGGSNATNGISVYACLVGKMLDNSSETNEVITIPITRLPTTLGKEHNTKDPSFVGLKESTDDKAPKLSQSMCTIFYRDAYGGKLGLYKKGKKAADTSDDPLDGMIYKPYEPPVVDDEGNNEKPSSSTQPLPDDILRLPNMDSKASLPPHGFYSIECTGRKIMVGGRTIKKGQFAMLSDGMAIKIASHCFYFLLPKVSSNNGKPPPSITVQVTTSIKAEKKRRSDSMSSVASVNSVEKDSGVLSPQPPPAKKAKTKKASPQVVAPSSATTSSATKDNDATVVHQPVVKPKKKSSGKFDESIFDSKTDMQLLQMLSQKVTAEGSTWDHEAQKLGAAIAQRVCLAASKSPSIISISNTNNGVTQREIVDWMNTSETSIFKEYERMVLSKIEKKSFMTNIGKGMVKVGYTKNAVLSGRSWRFTLPGQPDRSVTNVPKVDSGVKKSETAGVKGEEKKTNEESKQVAAAATGGGEEVVVQQHPPQAGEKV